MVFFSLLLLSLTAQAGWLEMADLMAHPEQYDRKEVVVVGTVHHVEPVVDKQGHPAFKFLLGDGVGTLRVISRAEVTEGEQVIVEGTFSRRRQSGRLPVYSEVSANYVRPLNAFTPELVG
jgi:hypothetical protein